MKKLVLGVSAALCALAVSAAVTVKDVSCRQRYPWNGMVDIDYTVESDDAAAAIWVYPVGQDHDLNVSMAPRALSGDGVNAPVKPGTYRMTWNVSADYPNFSASAFSVKMTALTGGVPYLVIDLSGGVDALSYPVSYLSSVPAGGWTDEYKTTKLVLRLIPPGTFLMGSPSDEFGRQNNEGQHRVTLTKPFYIGVFEVTRRQYELVMGSASTARGNGATIPAHELSYYDLRGSVNGAAWPAHSQVDANSFMGRIRAKTNLAADLPTEAQWEYACRAGTGTALNNGKNITSTEGRCANLDEVAWYYPKTDYSNFTAVGQFRPNAWGLYDMHGNAKEWCLDRMTEANMSDATDPKGHTSNDRRVLRGGGCSRYEGSALYCRSAMRTSRYPSSRGNGSYEYGYFGFRLLVLPVAE